MDFFKFNPTGEETILERGEVINNLDRSMWVERYSAPGEFSFEAKLSSRTRENLPLGTLISHVDTMEVMIVENHEIKETTEEDPSVVITGRSFPSFLENRIVGTTLMGKPTITPYVLRPDYTWNQIVTLINDHIVNTNSDDQLDNVSAQTHITDTGESISREINRGTVWERLAELLKVDDLGIKTVRRNTWNYSGLGGSPDPDDGTVILIYKGVDLSSKVIFSWKSGDLSSTDYHFTQKGLKTGAVVVGQYIWAVVYLPGEKYDRRTMLINATDIDGNYGGVPSSADIPIISETMRNRGLQTLANQNRVTITQADVSKTTKYHYRRDYNIGDLVTLDGNFNQMAIMRVVEYAEIEDENGESGHPTLARPTVPGATSRDFM